MILQWRRLPHAIAALLVVAALFVGIRWGSFVAAGSDASGYVSQAEMWLRGELTMLAPQWARDGRWNSAGWTSAPLGYRPSEISYILVPTYSPGLPMAMALFQAAGGRDAVYYVVPLLGALTIWATYLLGSGLGGPWAGVLGAALMVSSPTFLLMLVQPLSDVPAAGLWGIALWLAWRDGWRAAAAAGLAAALAILTRPNLAPLAAVVGLMIVVRRGARVRDVAAFAAPIVPAALGIALLNSLWYGSPLRSGYGTPGVLYAVDRIWPNLRNYVGWMLGTQTPLVLLAFGAPFAVDRGRLDRRMVWLTTVVFPLAVFLLYLPYFVFEVWWYLRFLLPAYPPLLAAVGAVAVAVVHRAARPLPARAAAALLVCAVAVYGVRYSGAFELQRLDRRYVRMAAFVTQLPPQSVFVSLAHSGSIRYYTGRDVLRWEILDPDALDTAVTYLKSRGHEVYLAADTGEVADFKRRFAASATVRALDRAAPIDVGEALLIRLEPRP
jgi:hypothetical protein